MDGLGNFVLTWMDKRSGDFDIYAQRYDSLGSELGLNFRVNDDTGSFDQGYPSVAMDGLGNFVLTWMDKRNGDYDIYAQRYDSLGSVWGSNYRVVADFAYSDQWAPCVAVSSDRLSFTWMDARRLKGWDIYAKVVTWDWEGVGVEQRTGDRIQGRGIELSQNWPNPFSDQTVISYQLSAISQVKLMVYNLAGQLVKTLIDEPKEPGKYSVRWNRRDNKGLRVSSGVYLYRLEIAGETLSRMMVVI